MIDDVVLAHDSPELLRWFKEEFTGAGGFNATHKGKLDWFLGMAVDQHSDNSITGGPPSAPHPIQARGSTQGICGGAAA